MGKIASHSKQTNGRNLMARPRIQRSPGPQPKRQDCACGVEGGAFVKQGPEYNNSDE